MKIGFIGAGKVGFSLGKYFSMHGHQITGYYSEVYIDAKEAALFTNSSAYSSIEPLLHDSTILFITTPDDRISEIWQTIKHSTIKDKIICHTSGSLSSTVFSDRNNSGAYGYSIHPIFAFSDKLQSYKDLQKAYFSIEGDSFHLSTLQQWLESMGNKVLLIDQDKKHLYHLASVTVANLVLSLLHKGCSYLTACGVKEEDAFPALLPLIQNNISNIEKSGFLQALTGPVERNDVGTIQHHLKAIPKEDKALYEHLSLHLISLCEEKQEHKNYEKLKAKLGGTEN